MIKGVPFFRDLTRCRGKDFVEAAKEVISILLLAVIPVWIGAVVMMLIPRASVGHYIQEFLTSGEALLVSAALAGPSVYIITKKYGDLPKSLSVHFPQGWFLIIVSLAICMITSAVFGFQRGYSQFQPHQSELFDPTLMYRLSLAILVATFATLYIVTVFRNFVEDGASLEMHSETNDFLNQWRAEGKGSSSGAPK
jgi:hypothetical protein